MPLTNAPDAATALDAMTCPSTKGATRVTPSTLRMASAIASNSPTLVPMARTIMCPFRPKILPRSSVRNPFITAITMMSVATPSIMPAKEKPAMTEIKPSRRRARRYRRETIHSKPVKGFVAPFLALATSPCSSACPAAISVICSTVLASAQFPSQCLAELSYSPMSVMQHPVPLPDVHPSHDFSARPCPTSIHADQQ